MNVELTASELRLLMDFMVDGRTDQHGRDIYVGDIYKGTAAHALYHKLLAALEATQMTSINNTGNL